MEIEDDKKLPFMDVQVTRDRIWHLPNSNLPQAHTHRPVSSLRILPPSTREDRSYPHPPLALEMHLQQ